MIVDFRLPIVDCKEAFSSQLSAVSEQPIPSSPRRGAPRRSTATPGCAGRMHSMHRAQAEPALSLPKGVPVLRQAG
jgi:hypothetical protein